MKLTDLKRAKRNAKFKRGLKKSRSLRSIKQSQFNQPEQKKGFEVQG